MDKDVPVCLTPCSHSTSTARMARYAGAVALLALLIFPRNASAQESYLVIDIGTLGGSQSSVTGINARGQVTGAASLAGDTVNHAFLYEPSDGTLKDLGTLGAATLNSAGSSINSSGEVAGWSDTADGLFHAFISGPQGGALRDLGTVGGDESAAYAINDSGEVTGVMDTLPSGFVSSPQGKDPRPLVVAPLFTGAGGYGISASGEVTGGAGYKGVATHAFIGAPQGGPLRDLGTLPGGTFAEGWAINDLGQVTGDSSRTARRSPIHAFISDANGGPLKDLGTLGGVQSTGRGINQSGVVTGISTIAADESPHAFLYRDGRMVDLNKLIGGPLTPYVTLTQGTGINASGWIVANGVDSRTGNTHGYLLKPVSDPGN